MTKFDDLKKLVGNDEGWLVDLSIVTAIKCFIENISDDMLREDIENVISSWENRTREELKKS